MLFRSITAPENSGLYEVGRNEKMGSRSRLATGSTHSSSPDSNPHKALSFTTGTSFTSTAPSVIIQDEEAAYPVPPWKGGTPPSPPPKRRRKKLASRYGRIAPQVHFQTGRLAPAPVTADEKDPLHSHHRPFPGKSVAAQMLVALTSPGLFMKCSANDISIGRCDDMEAFVFRGWGIQLGFLKKTIAVQNQPLILVPNASRGPSGTMRLSALGRNMAITTCLISAASFLNTPAARPRSPESVSNQTIHLTVNSKRQSCPASLVLCIVCSAY